MSPSTAAFDMSTFLAALILVTATAICRRLLWTPLTARHGGDFVQIGRLALAAPSLCSGRRPSSPRFVPRCAVVFLLLATSGPTAGLAVAVNPASDMEPSTPDCGDASQWNLQCSDDSVYSGLGIESLFMKMMSLSALECKLVQRSSPSPLSPAVPPDAVVSRAVVPLQPDLAQSRIKRRRTSTLVIVNPGVDTLQMAYTAASLDDVLELKDGTYTTNLNFILQIATTKGVTVRAQNPGMAILDGQGAKMVLQVSGGAVVVLEGLVITGGYGIGDPAGGGIIIGGSTTVVTITGCLFHSNTASWSGYGYGAAVYVMEGDVRILNSVFRNHNMPTATDPAPAIYYKSPTRPGMLTAPYVRIPWANLTFDNNDKAVQIVTPVQWSCPLGRYMPDSGVHTGDFVGCKYDCFVGFYGDSPTLTDGACSGACPEGHYCTGATVEPTPCVAGTYLPVTGGQSADSCFPCIPGTFSAALGNPTACSPCPAGSYSANLRSTNCTACLKGGYCSSEGAISAAMAFTPCPAGTYNPSEGATSIANCTACPPGTFGASNGATSSSECEKCPVGFFQPVSGAGSIGQCQQCPPRSTSDAGAVDASGCLCLPDYYDSDGAAIDSERCQLCPSGADCSRAGTTIFSLPIMRGYFRLSNRSIDVRKCPDAGATPNSLDPPLGHCPACLSPAC